MMLLPEMKSNNAAQNKLNVINSENTHLYTRLNEKY